MRQRVFCCLLALLFSLSSCAVKNKPLFLGFSAELSGDRLSEGIQIYQGAEQAVDLWNRKGGIRGRTVEFLVRDNEGDPDLAVSHLEEFSKLGVEGIVGFLTSSTAVPVLDTVNRVGIPVITPSATASDLIGKKDWLFTLYGSNAAYARKTAEFAKNILKVKRVSVLLDYGNREYSEDYLKQFISSFSDAEHEISAAIPFIVSEDQKPFPYLSLINEALVPDPDALMIIASALDSGLFLQQMHRKNLDIPVFLCDWASNEQLIQLGGPYVERAYFAEIILEYPESDLYKEFTSSYLRRFGLMPSLGAYLGFESTHVLLQGLSESGNPKDLRAVLLNKTFDSFGGTLLFNEYGDAKREIVIKTIRGGKFVTLP